MSSSGMGMSPKLSHPPPFTPPKQWDRIGLHQRTTPHRTRGEQECRAAGVYQNSIRKRAPHPDYGPCGQPRWLAARASSLCSGALHLEHTCYLPEQKTRKTPSYGLIAPGHDSRGCLEG